MDSLSTLKFIVFKSNSILPIFKYLYCVEETKNYSSDICNKPVISKNVEEILIQATQ